MNPALSRAPLSGGDYFAVEFDPAAHELVLLDQRRLPEEELYLRCRKPDEIAEAIRTGAVRGAGASAVAAGYALALQASLERGTPQMFLLANGVAGRVLGQARPSAAAVSWIIARMARAAGQSAALEPEARFQAMLREAELIHEQDAHACRQLSGLAANRFEQAAVLLTLGSGGALASGGWGTTLGVARALQDRGKQVRVVLFARQPLDQDARVATWELTRLRIDVEVVTEDDVSAVCERGQVELVLVNSERIARSGDVASAKGSHALAELAQTYALPFVVATPWSSFDPTMPNGTNMAHDKNTDVIPASAIDAIITERGSVCPKRGEQLVSLRG